MRNDELLDLVNEKDEIIGTVWKSQAHSNPRLIHREIGILVVTKNKEVLFHKRSLKKAHDPGQWQLGVAGHVGAKESPEKAAKRELYEEIGLKGKLTFSYKFFDQYKKESRFFWTYYILLDEKQNLDYHKDEIDEIKWVNYKDLEKFEKEHPSHAMDKSSEIVNKIIKTIKF